MSTETRLIGGIRRAWALVGSRERKRLRLVAAYGVVIAGLDTLALILLYALTTLFADQPLTGAAKWLVPSGQRSADERYHEALVLLAITAGSSSPAACFRSSGSG